MDVRQLLRKKGWTGEETGKALILDIIHSYQQTQSGKRDRKPLFPHERISEMVRGFYNSRTDAEAYTKYVNLQNWIMQYQAVANAHLQRFLSTLNEFTNIHNAAESAENEYRYIEQLPRILTEKQYNELKAKRIEETLDPDGDGSDAIGDNLFSLIIRAVEYYGRELEANPKKANPLKAVKKLYQGQPLKDKALIAAYNKITGEGYYQLPDGTRSDKVTPQEWQKRLLDFSPGLKRLFEEGEQGLTGEPGSLSYERLTKSARAAHMGEPAPEEEKGAAVWHEAEEAPEGVTKWDFIAACIEHDTLITGHGLPVSFALLYPSLISGATAEEWEEQAKAFKESFPEIVKAILKALDALGFTYYETPLSSIPVENWAGSIFLYRELYNSGFPGFREEVESDFNIFDGDARALRNGVAVLRPSNSLNFHFSAAMDENGYFREPDGQRFFTNQFGLSAYLPDNPESGDNIARIEQKRAEMRESLRFLIGYDTALELIAKEIDIPEFTIFNAQSANCIERTEAMNNLFDLLYTHIEAIEYRDEEQKQAKLQALRDVFYPLDTKALAISSSTKAQAAAMLEDLGAFADGRTPTMPGWNFLMLLTTEEGGGAE